MNNNPIRQLQGWRAVYFVLTTAVLRMATTEEVTFEVLILIGTRWETQGVYKAKDQGRAVADAKSLEKVSTIKGVKVVKEFYDNASKTSRSLNVYESQVKGEPTAPAKPTPAARPASRAGFPSKAASSTPAAKGKAAKSPGKAGRSSSGSLTEDMVGAPAASANGEKRPSFLSVFVQIVLSFVAASIAGIAVTQLANVSMRNMHSIGFLSRNDFLILVFILVFAITGLALITRILTKLKRIAPVLPSLPLSMPKSQPKPKPRPHYVKPHIPTPAPAPEAGKDVAGSADQAEAEKLEANKSDADQPDGQKTDSEKSNPTEVAIVESASTADPLSEVVTMNAFTADVMDVIKGEEDKRDAHTVFGVVLFLVGAVQALRAQKNLNDATYAQILHQTLGAVGLPKERAQHFIEHTDEYLVANARYSQMFQNGRHAMAANLESSAGPRVALADALDEWDKPKTSAENNQPVTVLFTDIAGSTAMTQKLGDAGAQEVVRVHNTIVRDALKSFGGKEVKHTGDGIMASFPSTVPGVEAAIDMQRQTKVHNAAHPDLPLGLKIGLNAGEPIAEDDDLFGVTVQLAARIVDKAQSGQVLVSGSVQGLSQGKNLKFERFGDVDMKGFDEPVTLYAALWDPDAPPSAPTPAKAETPSTAKAETPSTAKPKTAASPAPDGKP